MGVKCFIVGHNFETHPIYFNVRLCTSCNKIISIEKEVKKLNEEERK